MAKQVAAHSPSRLKEKFLKEFRKSGNITVAAEAVGMDRRTHYTWLEQDDDEGTYAKAFADATEDAADLLEAEAHRRAVEGVEEPVGWYQGEAGGHVRRYSDTLLIVLLKMRGRFRDGVEVTGKDGGPLQVAVTHRLVDPRREAADGPAHPQLPPGDAQN